MMAWPEIKLREVIRLDLDPVPVDADKTYEMVGIYSFGRGLFKREPVSGASTSYKHFYRLKADHVVMSQLFGWEGALALCSEEFSGQFVSPMFPTFVCDFKLLDRKFLGWVMRRPKFWEDLGTRAKGMGDRRRTLNPESLFESVIPLPPLPEQRRIVERIEALAAKINEAKNLREQAAEEAEAIHLSVLHQHFVTEAATWTPMEMQEAIEINDKQVDPKLAEYSRLPHISGENIESKTCRLLPWRTAEVDGVRSNNYLFSSGTILYSKIRPYLRKAVFVDFRGVCSADVYPIRVVSPKLDPHFVKWTLVAEPFTEYANRLSGRTRMPKLNRKQLFGFGFSRPPLSEQRRIVAYLDGLQAQVEALKKLQSETAAELDALLPSILDRAFRGELVAVDVQTVEENKGKEKTTPWGDDGAVATALLQELVKRNRPTSEFFIQKHIFFLKERMGFPINSQFDRKAAGPWSHQLREKAIYAGVKKNWLRWEGNHLTLGRRAEKGMAKAKELLGDGIQEIAALVAEVETFGYPGLERWATILYIVRELEKTGKPVTHAAIQAGIDSWSDKRAKAAFAEDSVNKAILGMEKLGWIKLAK